MADVKVLHKKSCFVPSSDKLVYIKQFMIVEEDGRKYLVPRFVNSRAEQVTAVRVCITQYAADGAELSRSETRLRANGAAGKPFVADGKIPLSDDAEDCKIKVLAAEYGKYMYKPDGNTVAIDYNAHADELDDTDGATRAAVATKAGKSGITITRRTAKMPVLVIFALIVALALAAGAVFAHLKYFVAHEKTFLYSGVEYAFEDDDKSNGSNIYVVGFHGGRSRIVIPDAIEGHKVIAIADSAFAGNKSLTSIGFKSEIPVGARAFENCVNLREVEFDKITSIGAGAFKNCVKLESVVINNNISLVPKDAFNGCAALTTVTVTDGETDIEIGSRAFANCKSLKNVEFLRNVDYSYNRGQRDWFTGSTVQRLRINNYELNPYGINAISLMFGKSGANTLSDVVLKELVIDNLDRIPVEFCANLPLTAFEVKNINSTEINSRAFLNCKYLSKFAFPKAITAVYDSAFYNTAITAFNGSALTAIGNDAFGRCADLKTFTTAGNALLQEVGERAFAGCESLVSFTVPSGVTEFSLLMFENCTSLAEIKYARGTSIGKIHNGAFYGCTALEKFDLPDGGLTTIGDQAFANCSALQRFDVTEAVAYIGDFAFSGCKSFTSFTVPDSVYSFGNGALRGCDSLTELTVPFLGNSRGYESYIAYTFGATNRFSDGKNYLPSSLATVNVTGGNVIDSYAFNGCSDIIEINLPQTIDTIGANAFAACASLKESNIPVGVTTIGERAFNGCSALTELIVPRGVTSIGLDAFGGCSALKKLTVPFVGGTADAYSYLEYVFGKQDIWTDGNVYVPSSLESVEVTAATRLGSYAFANCAGVREISLPDSLLNIGSHAFADCDALTSLTVPNSVTQLDRGAFYGTSFEELTLPFVGRARAEYADDGDETKRLSYLFNGDYYFIPQRLKKITLTDTEYIADNAFSGFGYIEQIALDCAVEHISATAFNDCYRLFEVFNYGSRLNIVKGSDDNGGIARYALKVHTDRTEEPLPQYKSDHYRFVRDDDGNTYMLDCDREENLVLPSVVNIDGITINSYSVWQYLFYLDCVIRSVFIPASVTYLGESAFNNCYNLESVEFEASSPITEIKENTFMYCRFLHELILPQRLNKIGAWAFGSCSRLKKVTVPRTVGVIDDNAFFDCKRLFEVYNRSSLNIVAGSATHGGIAANAYAVYRDESQSIESVTINGVQYMKLCDGGIDWWAVDYYGTDGVLEIVPFTHDGTTVGRIGIYESAFVEYYNVEKVTVSNAVARINNEFSACFNLREFKLTGGGANAKVEIADEAFAYLSLNVFTADAPVSSIGRHAFRTDNMSRANFAARVDRVCAEAFFSETDSGSMSAQFAEVGIFESNAFTSANIESLNVAGSTETINQNAFNGLDLKTATFNDVGTIGTYAFSDCYNLETVTFGNVNAIDEYAFKNSRMKSANFGTVGTIGANAFARCGALNTVSLAQGDNLVIGNNAFDTSGLSSFVYGGRISSIGDYAFNRCSNLTKVELGAVGVIGANAFTGCSSIMSVAFTGNVDDIGESAFANTPVNTLDFGGNIGRIRSYAFNRTNVQSLVFANDVGTIDGYAFQYCVALKRVEFKGALASLGDGVFSGCNGLNSVVLPRGLRAIAAYTFDGCSSIEEIIVPQDVVEIGNLAFANCYNLHRVELPASLSRVVSGAFSGSDYIFAVYNQSALELSGDMFGDVLVVSSDKSKTLLTYHAENEFAFVKADGTWYLYNVMYASDVTTILPDYFIADGERIERYKVRGGATGLAGRNLLVSKSVTGLRRNALRENISIVYYDGTAQQWRNLDGSNYVTASVLFRSDCIHEGNADGLWRYSDYNTPTTAYTTFADSAWTVIKQSTCKENGLREADCPHCKKKITETIAKSAHVFDKDGKCTVCGKMRTVVTSDNVSSIGAIKNDSRNPFEVSADGVIKSTNKKDGSSSTFTLTADGAMDVAFDIRVSSEDSYDKFKVVLNDRELYSISGNNAQTGITLSLKVGDKITFTYSKDGSGSSGDDCGYIINLALIYAED